MSERVGLHLQKVLTTNHVLGLRSQRQVQAYHVGLGVDILLSDPLELQFRHELEIRLNVVDQHPGRAEGGNPPQDAPADASGSDDSHCDLGETAAHVTLPRTLVHLQIGDVDRSKQRQHQSEGQLGDCGRGRIGRIGHLDAASFRGDQIDAIEADSDAGNQFQLARPRP